jgi:2-polyprenyl-3-methyl-5-hydroxy-6-metoxy-1,4-benzoquinol methylase
MQRFDWQEMREYWGSHHGSRAWLDLAGDPDGLDNVCHTGAPRWLNEYYARYQALVYRRLLAKVPRQPGQRALDIGCGAGRWCKLLAEEGFEVEGIDLQTELLELNRQRYPHIAFHDGAVQEFTPGHKFDLVSSVTVIAHNPFDQQGPVVRKLRELLNTGGHALILENISHQATHVFANPAQGWKKLFADEGFEFRHQMAYDYSPAIRSVAAARRAGSLLLSPKAEDESKPARPDDPQFLNGHQPTVSPAIRTIDLVTQRVAVFLDDQIERALVPRQPSFRSVHAGFVFQAV